jgi:hypothetical protein
MRIWSSLNFYRKNMYFVNKNNIRLDHLGQKVIVYHEDVLCVS